MPQISGMVFEGQNPETRVQDVITSASWITESDMPLVLQGKQAVFDEIENSNWEAPFMWTIQWINIPAQQAQQQVNINVQSSSGVV